jgi:hypothetical protein
MDTSNLKGRYLCAAICLGLDDMRFWERLGHEGPCKAILRNIMRISSESNI